MAFFVIDITNNDSDTKIQISLCLRTQLRGRSKIRSLVEVFKCIISTKALNQ